MVGFNLSIIISITNPINMSEPFPVPENGGAAFFGFMGVTLALVLASKTLHNQTLEPHTEPPRPALASVASPSGDPTSS